MFILSFLAFISFFFILLWLSDIFFTVKSVGKLGNKVEMNPLMRFFLKTRRRFLWVFKILELSAFLALIYFLSYFDAEQSFYVLLAIIFIYSLVVSQGMYVYLASGGNPRAVVIVFFLLCLIGLLFVNLNYSTFNNTGKISDALTSCNLNYNELYHNCTGSIATVSSGQKIDDFGLNISIS